MSPEELRKREERATKETFVIARTDEGFRIHNPTNGGHVYYVTGTSEEPLCTCPDFQRHQGDPEWRCKHILAVTAKQEPKEDAPAKATRKRRKTALKNEVPRMSLKRSVSPDGKIDALSVEFSAPVEGTTDETVARAQEVLGIQDRIAQGFLKQNGRNGRSHNGSRPAPRRETAGQADSATILEVGGSDGRWGRRLFLVFQVNGRRLRLFGSEKKLAQAVRYAGFPEEAEGLEEGTRLDLPCRVETQPTEDGKYVNVVKVFPAREERSATRW